MMIDKLSNNITAYIERTTPGIDAEKAEVINYGLNILIYQSMVTALLLLVGLICKVFMYVVIALFIYGILRIYAGGAHAKTRSACLVVSSISIYAPIFLAKAFNLHNPIFFILIGMVGLLLAVFYAPGDTQERPIRSSKKRTRQKSVTMILILALSGCEIVMLPYTPVISQLMAFITIPVLFFMTPLGYVLLKCKPGACEQKESL